MAYLTQYSDNVPVVKFLIDQTSMLIGQHIDTDICVPEDGIADTHAALLAISNVESYKFEIKAESNQNIQVNGEEIKQAELKDGDWIILGDVEFQFTDDGIYEFVQAQQDDLKPGNGEVQTVSNQEEPEALTALKVINDIKKEVESMTPESMIKHSQQFSRRLRLL